jgi:hypothetical protein
VVESDLDGEIIDHLGYDHGASARRGTSNSRNGTRSQTVITDVGPVEIVPAGLGVHIRAQTGVLGFDRIWLVFVVGGSADIDPASDRVEIIEASRPTAFA